MPLFLSVSNIFLLILIPVLVHGCGHTPPKAHELGHTFVEHGRAKRAIETHHNLRIHLTYDESIHRLPADKSKLIKEVVMLRAISYWETALNTRRLSKPIRLARSCNDAAITYRSTSDDVSERQPYCVRGCAEQTKCGDMVVPPEHLQGCRQYTDSTKEYEQQADVGPGVTDSDFLLYVAANDSKRCQTSIAYATYCQLEVEFDRPIAGFINICPGDLSTHETQLELAVATVKHEMLHALGFSLSLFGFYRDANGDPLTPRTVAGNRPPDGPDGNYIYSDRVVRNITRYNWRVSNGVQSHSVKMIVTPKVKEAVRRHFDCPTLEGAELENQGTIGTRLTHWEKRVFENELMTGIYTQNPAASEVTLALMEDTGWYLANYSLAEPLVWGAKLGCDFVQKSCLDWILTRQQSDRPISPFCTTLNSKPLKTECTAQRDSMALCNMHTYSGPLPAQYQYFADNPAYGGVVNLADFCPYLQEFSWKKDGEYVRGSDCLVSSNMPHPDSNFAAEYYGANSKCFDQSEPFQLGRCSQTFVSNNYGSGCYKYTCSAKDGLTIHVEKESFRCYQQGQKISVGVASEHSLHTGTIVCPACQDVCKGEGFVCPPEQTPPPRPVKDFPFVPCSSVTLYSSLVYTQLILIFLHALS